MKKLNLCFTFVFLLSLLVVNHGASLDWKEFILELENELEIDRYLKVIIPIHFFYLNFNTLQEEHDVHWFVNSLY